MQETNIKPKNNFEITTRSGETIRLDPTTVKDYLCGGQPISNSEFTMFFQLCKTYQVNPFLREAYIIKYGTSPATIVLDYKVLQQIADSHPQYKGMVTGVLVEDKNGNAIERKGAFVLSSEKLVAGWCEVYRKDREEPTKTYAMFDEFKQTNKAGELNSNWKGKPTFMIVKVAKAQALREAFPNAFGSNIYSTDEINVEEDNKDYVDGTLRDVETRVNENINNARKVENGFNNFNENVRQPQYNNYDNFFNDRLNVDTGEVETNDYDFEERI